MSDGPFDKSYRPDSFLECVIPPVQLADETTVTATHTVTVTPELGAYLLKNCHLPGQRSYIQRKIDEYGITMRIGRFEPESHMEMAYCRDTARFYLLNGYHRIKAIIATGMPLEVLMTMHRVNTMGEVMRRYGVIDKGQSRSVAQTIKAANMTNTFPRFSVASIADFASQHVRLVTASVRMIVAGFRLDTREARNLDNEYLLVPAVGEWLDEAKLYLEIIHKGEAEVINRMRTAAVLSVGIVLLRAQPEAAHAFLSDLAHNRSGLGADSPIYKLRRYMSKHRVHDDGQNVYARKVASAWNAYFRNEALQNVNATGSLNIDIAGTPYTRFAPLYYVSEDNSLAAIAAQNVLSQELIINKQHPDGALLTTKGVFDAPEIVAAFIEYRNRVRDAKRRGIGKLPTLDDPRYEVLAGVLDDATDIGGEDGGLEASLGAAILREIGDESANGLDSEHGTRTGKTVSMKPARTRTPKRDSPALV